MGIGAGHHHFAGFNRLAQGFQGLPREFGEFIHEQHAVVGQGYFARTRPPSAPHNGRHGRCVVRFTKRAFTRNAPLFQQSRQRMNHGCFQRFARRQGWQNAGNARRQHGLSRPGRSHQQRVVAPGGGDFQGAFGAFLALHFGHVFGKAGAGDLARGRGRQHRFPGEMAQHTGQIGGCNHLCRVHPSRFRPAVQGAHQTAAVFGSGQGGGQTPHHGDQLCVQGQFPQHHRPSRLVLGHQAQGGQNGQGDGQIKMAAVFGHIGRRQVQRDPLGRQCDGHGRQSGPHAFLGLRHGFVGQAHNVERRQAGGHGALHLHQLGIYPFERH